MYACLYLDKNRELFSRRQLCFRGLGVRVLECWDVPRRHNLKYLTVAGSHTIGLIAAIATGAKAHPAWTTPLANVDGCICRDIVVSKCPSIAKPLNDGMQFVIIRSIVEDY